MKASKLTKAEALAFTTAINAVNDARGVLAQAKHAVVELTQQLCADRGFDQKYAQLSEDGGFLIDTGEFVEPKSSLSKMFDSIER